MPAAGIAEVAGTAEADAVVVAVAAVYRLGHHPQEVAAMRTCCAAGKSFEAGAAGSVHAVEDP